MSLKNKVKIYTTVIRPTLTYATARWCSTVATHLNRLESTQSKFLRIMADALWFIRNTDLRDDLKTQSIKNYIKSTATDTYTNAELHTNQLITDTISYNIDEHMIQRRPRHGMLL